jgi:hypothetical protein
MIDAGLCRPGPWGDLGQRLYAPTGTLALTGNGETWAARSAAVLAGSRAPGAG